MKKPKISDGGAAARAEAARKAAEQAAENLRKNMAVDLTTQNAGTVVAGGSADEVDVMDTSLKKRKSAPGALSSALGLNVS